MSRLIAFGCSHTYGHGLPDCNIDCIYPGKFPSKLGWPSTVAKYLNRQCVNKASPGASNKEIWHNIINFKFRKTDIAVILWANHERSTVFTNAKSVIKIGPWMETPSSRSYYAELYNTYDSTMQTKLYISHVNFLLCTKRIPTYNLAGKYRSTGIFKLSGQIIPHIPVYLCDNYVKDYPKALDGTHPGVESNDAFARDIVNYFQTGMDYQPKNSIQKLLSKWIQTIKNV